MAEDQGIHPDVMNHIVDLHRKISELQLSHHDKSNGGDEPHAIFHQMLEELQKLNANLEKLIPAVEADTKADLKEAGADKAESKSETKEGKNERRRERAGPPGASGEVAPKA